MKWLILLLVLALPFSARNLLAQEQSAVLQRAQTYQWYVRAWRGDSIMASGRVRAVAGDAVRIDTTRILFNELTLLERRTKVGGGWKRGALAGSVVMGALGVVAGITLCGIDDSGDDSCGAAVFLGAALAAGIGFPIGGMIGEVVRPGEHVWEIIWPSRN
jgi:hypothetical protein